MFVTTVCVLFLIKQRWLKNKSLYEEGRVSFDEGDSSLMKLSSFLRNSSLWAISRYFKIQNSENSYMIKSYGIRIIFQNHF